MAPLREGQPNKPHGDNREDAAGGEQTQKFRTIAPDAKKQAAETDLTGWQIGDFHLLRRLGRGGMAEVYLAEQRSLKRTVAFKVLRSELAADEKYIQRFQREAEAAAKISHAHIVQIYAVGRHDGVHYIAQEYVQGHNLKELLTRHGALDWHRAVEMLRQAGAALGRAAEAGIVHRDIKPENILLTREGDVKVADFGLARQLGGDKPLNITQDGTTMGTPLYMSPEQVEGKPLDYRSDLYSLGITAYHMLAGRPPFRGETSLAVAVQHVKSRPPPLAELRPDLPEGLCAIVHKMIAKSPDRRYQSSAELLRDLDRLGVDAAATLPRGERAGKPIAKKTKKSKEVQPPKAGSRWTPVRLRALYLLSLIITLGGGALLGWSRREPDLFAEGAAKPSGVPIRPTSRAQYDLARIRRDDEAAWKAVIDNFPANDYNVKRAQQELSYLYLMQYRLDDAWKLFEVLANLGNNDEEFRVHGLIGQAIILSLRGEYQASHLRLTGLYRQRLGVSRRMLQLLDIVVELNARNMEQQSDKRWREFLNETLSDEEGATENNAADSGTED